MIAPFCKAAQWARVERLLLLSKAKVPYRRAFMDLREVVQGQVEKALVKRPDPVGQALRDRLESENKG